MFGICFTHQMVRDCDETRCFKASNIPTSNPSHLGMSSIRPGERRAGCGFAHSGPVKVGFKRCCVVNLVQTDAISFVEPNLEYDNSLLVVERVLVWGEQVPFWNMVLNLRFGGIFYVCFRMAILIRSP